MRSQLIAQRARAGALGTSDKGDQLKTARSMIITVAAATAALTVTIGAAGVASAIQPVPAAAGARVAQPAASPAAAASLDDIDDPDVVIVDDLVSDPVVAAGARLLDPYVTTTSAGYVLNAPQRVLAQVNPNAQTKLRGAITAANEQVARGTLVVADGQVRPAHEPPAADSGDGPSALARGGHSECHWYWVPTCRYYLTASQTSRALTSSTAMATLLGGILGGPIGGALAGWLYDQLRQTITNRRWCAIFGYPVPPKWVGHYTCGT